MKLFPESDSFGITPKKIENYKFCGNSLLDPRSLRTRKLSFATLCLKIRDLPIVRLTWFLDHFIFTLNNRSYSVKFQDPKINTKISLRTILRRTV